MRRALMAGVARRRTTVWSPGARPREIFSPILVSNPLKAPDSRLNRGRILGTNDSRAPAERRRSGSERTSNRASGRLDQVPRERAVDQGARLGEAVEGDERPEARPTLLAEQHFVHHVEEVVRDAGPRLRRALRLEVLVARDRPSDVVERVLDLLGAGARRCRPELRRHRLERLALDCVGEPVALLRRDEIAKVSNGVADETV